MCRMCEERDKKVQQDRTGIKQGGLEEIMRGRSNGTITIDGNGPMTVQQLQQQIAELVAATEPESENDRNRAAVLDALRVLGGKVAQDDALVFEGTQMILPAAYKGRIRNAVKFLLDHEEQQEKEFEFSRPFPYRPYDGANAFQKALKEVFGTTGMGKDTQTFFGPVLPQYRTINTGYNSTTQVPWGEVRLEALEAVFTVSAIRGDQGYLFSLGVKAPRKYRTEIEAFFTVVEDTLRKSSIYKGKAIRGTGMEPEFLNVTGVDPGAVVYSDDTITQLDANLWTVIEHTDRLRRYGMEIKRAVLLEGPFGTGKTLAATLTAQRCAASGWTFIECRPGVDDMHEVLATAALYSPTVVHIEDIDKLAVVSDPGAMSKLLDTLDGISGKGKEVVALFTTNYVERLPKALLRPGRISSVIHIGELDLAGMTKLVEYKIPADQRDLIDYARVFAACAGYMPAYTVEVIDRAVRYAIAQRDEVRITTEDLVNAARGMRPQHGLMQEAGEGVMVGGLDGAVTDVLEQAFRRTELVDRDGDSNNLYLQFNEEEHAYLRNAG